MNKQLKRQIKSIKAPEPSGITAEMIKALGQDGIDCIYIILNDFMKNEKLPNDMKESETVTICYLQTEGRCTRMRSNVETTG